MQLAKRRSSHLDLTTSPPRSSVTKTELLLHSPRPLARPPAQSAPFPPRRSSSLRTANPSRRLYSPPPLDAAAEREIAGEMRRQPRLLDSRRRPHHEAEFRVLRSRRSHVRRSERVVGGGRRSPTSQRTNGGAGVIADAEVAVVAVPLAGLRRTVLGADSARMRDFHLNFDLIAFFNSP